MVLSRWLIHGFAAACLAGLACTVGLLPAAWAQAPADDVQAMVTRIAGAYENGRCAQVVAFCDQLAQQDPDAIDGITHYRWGFCQARIRRGDPAVHYERAAEMLTQAVSGDGGGGLEEHFYRVNALINLQRPADAVAAARDAVKAWNEGYLLLSEGDPTSWFRLGKLFRDAGDLSGALDPFARALDLAESGHRLRDAYVERIARGAREAGDQALAARASALLGERAAATPADQLRLARTRLAAGDLAGAREAFLQADQAQGSAGMVGQYALEALDRAEEVRSWGLEPVRVLPDGSALATLPLDRLQRELIEASRLGYEIIGRPTVERPRKKGSGTRPGATPENIDAIREHQARFAGLLLEALRRGAPIREWSVQGGFGPLIHHRWLKLHLRHDWESRHQAILDQSLVEEDEE